jgi:hypothetical protein
MSKTSIPEDSVAIISEPLQTRYITQGGPFWVPAERDLLLIDSLLHEATKDTSNNVQITNFRKYFRQYVCYKDSTGDLIAYVNGFCRLPEIPVSDSAGNVRFVQRDWKHEIIWVLDGGVCFWQMRINLTRKNYYDFFINGEA